MPHVTTRAPDAIGAGEQRSRLASLRRPAALLLCVLLFLAAGTIMVLTFEDYGITWDEHWQSTYGELIIAWYTSAFQDARALDFWLLKYYGGLFEVLANSIDRFSPLGHYETRHLVTAGFGLLGAFGTYLIGSLLKSRATGVLAATMLLLTPVYWGHSFNNSKDIPFAACFTLALYFLLRAVREWPQLRWRTALLFGGAAGASMAIRVGGVLLFIYALVALTMLTWQGRNTQGLELRRLLRGLLPRLLTAAAVAYAVMLVFWPAAQVSPIAHPFRSLMEATNFAGPRRVLFEGKLWATESLPWYYLPKWMLLTLPEFIIAGFGMGALLVAAHWIRRRYQHRPFTVRPEMLVFGFAIGFPFVYTAATRPLLYDGMRHFIFLLPVLAVAAAGAWLRLFDVLANRVARWSAVAVMAGLLLLTLADMIALHPHEYVYFNRAFAGGLSRAAGSYETDYWGNSYREGVMWVRANYHPPVGEKIRVTSCSYPLSTRYYLPTDRFHYLPNVDADADLFLATTRNDCHLELAGEVVHIVKRQGVPLLYVKQLRDVPRAP